MTRFNRSLAALAMACYAVLGAAQTSDLQEISKLLRSGQHTQALERVNQYLAGRPKDAQGRFLKGLILTEQNKVPEAIDVLTSLAKDYPELPEPYNNLAVLYASQGQYEKARQSLEQSIRTHPAYATAYENLGDVYSKLASQAYDKALQLDSSNTTAQTKLALMRDLVTGSTTGRPTKPGAPTPRIQEATKAAPTVLAQAAPAASAPDSKTGATKAAAAESKPAAPPVAARPAPADGSEEVLKAVRAWAQAWSSKDVNGYLAFYGPDFKTPNGEARGAWEGERRRRITAPKNIEVVVESPRATINANNATVTFRQQYRSDSLKVNSTKTLTLVKANGKWLIQQERTGS